MKLTAETTIFNDDKVQQKFSELIVDADGIRTEVSKKVGDDEVISRINQSAESVKIQANKINIDGVITAVNDNTTTTINGDKITTGTLTSDNITVGLSSLTNALNEKAPSGAENTANNYITDVTSTDGIRVHDSHTSDNAIVINSSGMEVFKGGTTSEYSVAKYGDTARIGKEGGSHLILASDSMSMSDGTKDVFNLLQKTMYIYWNRNYKGRQFANSTDRHVDSWDTNTTISTWDSIAVNYKLNNTSKTKKITSISNGVLVNDEIYVHFSYSGTIITLTYGRGSSAASSDIIKLE